MPDRRPARPLRSGARTFVKSDTCPYCQREHDRVTGLMDENRPKDGDVTICWGCFEVGVFADNATSLRKPTAQEEAEIAADADLQKILRSARTFQQRRGGQPPT